MRTSSLLSATALIVVSSIAFVLSREPSESSAGSAPSSNPYSESTPSPTMRETEIIDSRFDRQASPAELDPDVHRGDRDARDSSGRGGEVEFALARSTLATAIETALPDRNLSGNELDALAHAALRLRRAQASLRSTPKDQEHADRRAAIQREIEQAVSDFSYLLEMSPAEFTRRVEPHSGIDDWSPDDLMTRGLSEDDSDAQVLIRPIAPNDVRE